MSRAPQKLLTPIFHKTPGTAGPPEDLPASYILAGNGLFIRRINNNFRNSPRLGRGTRTLGKIPAASKSRTVHRETLKYEATPTKSKSRGAIRPLASLALGLVFGSVFIGGLDCGVPTLCPKIKP